MIRRSRSALYAVAERCHAFLLNILGAKSVGVRALVVNGAGEFLLVKHTYREGWHTPGGGVFNGESPHQALKRELREEVGLDILGPPELFGVYRNTWRGRYDFPILYVVRNFRGSPHVADSDEIAEVRWFHRDNLPQDVTAKTRARMTEYVTGHTTGDVW